MSLLDEILTAHDANEKKVVVSSVINNEEEVGFNDDEGTCYKCLEEWPEPEMCRTCETCPDCCECEK